MKINLSYGNGTQGSAGSTGRITTHNWDFGLFCLVKDGGFVGVSTFAALLKFPFMGCPSEYKNGSLTTVSTVRPYRLNKRLESNMILSHNHLKRDFNKPKKHCVELSSDFEIVSLRPSTSRNVSGKAIGTNKYSKLKAEKESKDPNPTILNVRANTFGLSSLFGLSKKQNTNIANTGATSCRHPPLPIDWRWSEILPPQRHLMVRKKPLSNYLRKETGLQHR